MFITLNYARVNSNATEYDAALISNAMTSSSNVKLSSALFRYNYIREDAITQGLIDYDNDLDIFYDQYSGGVLQNPYSEDYVFMFSAGRHITYDGSVTYDLSDLTAYGNCSVSGVLIDFGDGAGYVQTPSSNTCQITYTSPGTKVLKLKVTLQNNLVLESHTYIDYPAPPVAPSGSEHIPPDSTFVVSYAGISATCSVKFAAGHGHTAVKPLIYVEGFDHPVMNELGHFSMASFDRIKEDACVGSYCYDSLDISGIRSRGYDLFYVDWNNPEADILKNAVLLKDVIHKVNLLKPYDGSGARTVLVGHSMGGLVARCALKQMEISNDSHQVDYFISQDAPHLGAVLPIGAQYTIRDIYRCFYLLGIFPGVRNVAGKIAGVLECTAARQMMYNYIDFLGAIDNSVHQDFISYLNSIGFPKGDSGHPIENLSIVSGNALSSSELSNKIMTFGLFLTYNNIGPTLKYAFKNFTIYADIDRDRQSGSLVSTTMITHIRFNRLFPRVYTILLSAHTSPSTIEHMDSVPGSYLEFSLDNSFWNNNPFLYISVADKIVFVPAASSLSVPGYNASSYNNPSAFVSNCPFDSYCFEESPRNHCVNLSRYLDWIEEQTTMTADVPALVLTGDTMTISNKPSGATNETWTSSNTNIASISNGSITVNIPGVVTLSYSSRKEVSAPKYMYQYYTKNRKVLAGFPAMRLTPHHLSGNQYTVTASCVSTDGTTNTLLNSMVNNGQIKYIWGYKNSGNSYSWCDTTSNSTHSFIAPLGVKTHVCLKLYNGPGRESQVTVYDIDRTSTVPFLSDPQEVFVNSSGFSMNYQYVTGISSYKYYALWCNSSYNSSPIVPDTVEIGANTYPVVSTLNRTINGDQVTVYCFDIKNDPTLLQRISEVRAGTIPSGIVACVFIKVKSGGLEVDNRSLPIVSRISGPGLPSQ